jgi:cytochrome c
VKVLFPCSRVRRFAYVQGQTDVLLASAITLGIISPAQAQDATAVKRLFTMNCSACHSPKPGQNLVGPSLFNVINRQAGQIPDFHYSQANVISGLTWNVAALDRYLTAPREIVPGTKMTFPGLKDAKQRADVIAYLATLH